MLFVGCLDIFHALQRNRLSTKVFGPVCKQHIAGRCRECLTTRRLTSALSTSLRMGFSGRPLPLNHNPVSAHTYSGSSPLLILSEVGKSLIWSELICSTARIRMARLPTYFRHIMLETRRGLVFVLCRVPWFRFGGAGPYAVCRRSCHVASVEHLSLKESAREVSRALCAPSRHRIPVNQRQGQVS